MHLSMHFCSKQQMYYHKSLIVLSLLFWRLKGSFMYYIHFYCLLIFVHSRKKRRQIGLFPFHAMSSWHVLHAKPYLSFLTFLPKYSNFCFSEWFFEFSVTQKVYSNMHKGTLYYYNVFPVMYYANGLEMASFQQKSTTRFTAYIIFARPSSSFVPKHCQGQYNHINGNCTKYYQEYQ